MSKYRLTPEEFKIIYSQVPRLTIDPIVRTDKGIILALRKPGIGWANMWHLPGGTLFYRETIEQGLRRILKDEIGAEAQIIKLLGYVDFAATEEKERGFGHSVSLAILCDLISGELVPDEHASEVKIFLKLPENMIPEHEKFLLDHWQEISEDRF